tara:strand:- start:955 stop:2058 length:1104 start_codon:yes stop_codon:yes gene_type:complete
MKTKSQKLRILMSGGGSGGHVFPAIAIADAIEKLAPDTEFLFVGANGKIEMTAVPKAGYEIIGLPIDGLYRDLSLRTLKFPFKLIFSLIKAWFVVSKFKPDVAIGTAGYASGAALKIAEWKDIPTFLQEQNAYPGITNKILGKGAKKIYVAFETLDRFFPKDKLVLTGNPLRASISIENVDREVAFKYFDLDPNKKTIFLTGGSLGARTLNKAMLASLQDYLSQDIQLLWQCGKVYKEEYLKYNSKYVKVLAFVNRMDYAYAIADVLITRAGAGTISELALLGKPAILVPSPNVAEDHQTKNVMALVDKNASILVKDKDAIEHLASVVIGLLSNEEKKKTLGENIKKLAKPNAADEIAKSVLSEITK